MWGRIATFVGLSVCFLLFQNFSLDYEFQDIREIAPRAPAGPPPQRGYFPVNFHGGSMESVGNQMLKHNFGGQIKEWEQELQEWAGWEIKEGGSNDPGVPSGRAPNSYKLRTGHLGKDKIGFAYESDVRVKCEYSALKQDLEISVDKALSKNSSLSLKHINAGDTSSSVNFTYAW